MTQEARRIAVVGGGISGLAAAHRLIEVAANRGLPIQVALMEASSRAGGVISTIRRDGFLLEEGPDSIITDKPWGRRLAERIDIAGRLVGTQERFRKSYVVRRGRLEPTPDGFYLLAPTRFLPLVLTRIFSPLGKARMALDLVLPRGAPQGDESVAAFVTRRLGREALERMAQPMIGGIYGAPPERLSLRATFPRFLQMEQDHRSVILAMLIAGRRRKAMELSAAAASGPRYGLFVSFDSGLAILPETLVSRLPPGCLRLRAPVSTLGPRPEGGWLVATDRPEPFDAVILALPAPEAARLTRPFAADLAGRLDAIPYASAATVSMAFREEQIAHPLDGAGFVVPDIEGLSILGCTFGHRKYPGRAPAGSALVRAFWGDPAASLTDRQVQDSTLDDLRRLLGIRGAPMLSHLARWPRSMPQYPVGHLDLVDRIDTMARALHGFALAGNAYRGVGIPDCIHAGETAAERIIEQLFPPRVA
ncbi:MAG TPA: protoporphyrinogen oxidase [Candidatus Polarisedimenticolia bacterium]|nr:protoporphyrinogen oxidase [Candidatus Polarisedimenticolia bacterium]